MEIGKVPVNSKAAELVCVIGEVSGALLFPLSEALLTKSFRRSRRRQRNQCTRLATDLGLVHISVGDILRKRL